MKAIETNTQIPEFGKVRGALWPIHGVEMKKFLPMGLMMFFILFNYTILRSVKDSILVTQAGSAIVPYLKGLVVMPVAILFVVLYSKLVNIFSQEKVFYLISGFFISFFALYAFVLFPNNEFLLPDPAVIKQLQLESPRLQHMISIYAYWTDAIFYTMSELWGSIMLSLLFWQFANEITRTKEAARFYGLFGLLANFALILSGFVLTWSASIQAATENAVEAKAAYGKAFDLTMGSVILAGLVIVYLYYWMQRNVLTDPFYYDALEKTGSGKGKSKKPKLSVLESFQYLLTSKYIGFIALLVLAYGVSMNLIELNWKEAIRAVYPSKIDYQWFMGIVQFAMGFTTIIAILFFKGIVRRFGWFVGAITTPIMMVVTGAIFFMFILFADFMSPIAIALGVTSMFMAVIVGTLQNVLSKGTKYSLFDPTKEMAYIPLDQELKTKGKAAVDVIGGRLGKAGGGYVVMIIFGITGASDVLSITPIMAVVVGVVILLWMVAVGGLNRLYQAAVQVEEKEEAAIDKKLGKKPLVN
jgi:AAA family ATP:ADP antiporter